MQHQLSEFRSHILEKINEFKRVYRSNIPCFSKSNITIKELSMDRRSMRNYTDKQLYQATVQMAKHIENIITDERSALYEHKGLMKFIDEIKNVLKEHIEINNTIIHTGKYASRIYMSIIQDIHSTMQEKCKEIEIAISQKITKLRQLKHQDTLKSLNSSLESIKKTDINLYIKLLKQLKDN